jgi:hypothetical protein
MEKITNEFILLELQNLMIWPSLDKSAENLTSRQPPTSNKLQDKIESKESTKETSTSSKRPSSSKKSKAKSSRSALNDLLARQKQSNEQSASTNNLHNFLTQL